MTLWLLEYNVRRTTQKISKWNFLSDLQFFQTKDFYLNRDKMTNISKSFGWNGYFDENFWTKNLVACLHFRSQIFQYTLRDFFIYLSALALVGKFKKWSQISAPLLKTCIFDVRSSTKKLGSKFGSWLYRRAHHYERRFTPQFAVYSDGPGGRAMTWILSPIFLWSFSHQICMFLTMGQKSVTIFYIFQPGLLYIHIYELTM